MNGKYARALGLGGELRDLRRSVEKAAAGDEPSGGGGGPLGVAFIELIYPAFTSDGTGVSPSAIDMYDEVGDSGITSTSPFVSFGPGLYQWFFETNIEPTTNALASDLHAVRLIAGTPVMFGLGGAFLTTSTVVSTTTGSVGTMPFSVNCSGGADREYDMYAVYLTSVRWPLPA